MAFVWYHYVVHQTDVSISEINEYFEQNALPKYNITYLKKDLRQSKSIMKGSTDNTYKPVKKFQDDMLAKFPFIEIKSEEIITDDTVLPETLLNSTRGYIENLGKQINASYNNNIFDGCAVLMRRLLEILLIQAYEEVGKLSEISDGDGIKNLSYIINYTLSKKPFRLSKEASEVLDDFRQLGNFSAHKVQYNAKRKDIENVRLRYRVTIEELLYAAKFKK
ncbi:DUF4145 domain-containing protein [Elizabethkingia anophelis]|nr:DUF4145 domain-containing protein [Elizabethkingia anophelis]